MVAFGKNPFSVLFLYFFFPYRGTASYCHCRYDLFLTFWSLPWKPEGRSPGCISLWWSISQYSLWDHVFKKTAETWKGAGAACKRLQEEWVIPIQFSPVHLPALARPVERQGRSLWQEHLEMPKAGRSSFTHPFVLSRAGQLSRLIVGFVRDFSAAVLEMLYKYKAI